MAVEWDEIEKAASGMFNVWTSGGDLAFAKECWGHLSAAGLADDDNIVFRTEAYLRLIALRVIYGEFCAAKWDASADTEIIFLAEDLGIDRLALGLLASPHLAGDVYIEDDRELFERALTVASEAVRSETFECLRRAYGGEIGLYQRLCRTDDDRSEDYASDVDLSGNNMAAFEFIDRGGQS
jgi:hypothetical protein